MAACASLVLRVWAGGRRASKRRWDLMKRGCKTRPVSVVVNRAQRASVQRCGVQTRAPTTPSCRDSPSLWHRRLLVAEQHHRCWWNASSGSSSSFSSSCCSLCVLPCSCSSSSWLFYLYHSSCWPVTVLDGPLSALSVHILQLSVCVCATSDVIHRNISHPKRPNLLLF